MHRLLLIAPALVIMFFSCKETKLALQPRTVQADGIKDIVTVSDTLVAPILYQKIPTLDSLSVDETKAHFISIVLPAILVSKYYLNSDREQILALSKKQEWTHLDSSFVQDQMERFNGSSIKGLLQRMKTHPNSIVLAQAAVESGWGRSRFVQEANNLFGIWSYNSDEPRIKALAEREDDAIYVRRYEDIGQSITDYFETVGRSRAYRKFRDARSNTEDPNQLLPHLKYYSERREAYVEQLRNIIQQNNLTRYDGYIIDPAYFIEM